MMRAGLLACAGSGYLPVLPVAEQWSGVEIGSPNGTYSYGYSAGFAPDFPFHPPVDSGTCIAAKIKDSRVRQQ